VLLWQYGFIVEPFLKFFLPPSLLTSQAGLAAMPARGVLGSLCGRRGSKPSSACPFKHTYTYDRERQI
jgi:hypothetical protein